MPEGVVDGGPSPRQGLEGLFGEHVVARPDAEAIAFPGERLTYAELHERTQRAARGLLAVGVRPGDRVGLLMHGCPGYVALLFAIAEVGAISVVINARYKEHELRYLVDHSGLRALVTDPQFAPLLEAATVPSTCTVVLSEADLVARVDTVAGDDLARARDGIGGRDPALMMYTSGTTSLPKGCLHSHEGLLVQASAFAGGLGLGPGDRCWTPLPLYHVAGLCVMLAALRAGVPFVHVGAYRPDPAREQLADERCTVAVPCFDTIWTEIVEHPRFSSERHGALRLVDAIGVPERLRQMQAMVPWAVQVSSTGSTEAGGWLAIAAPDDPEEVRFTTVGRPLSSMQVRIVDPATGDPSAPGQDGELHFRGVSRFLEYYRDPEETAAVIDAEGWFHTGDMVRADEVGRIAYVGRYKDMLKVGGENVAAVEVEDFLVGHEAVAVAQVVAAPDARYGQVVAAFVELRPGRRVTEEELVDACRGRISTFKIPRYVRFVSEWPMSGTKIQKYALRERITSELRDAGISVAPRIRS